MTPASLAALDLLSACADLEDLAGWEPVGGRLEAAREALGGGTGLRPDEVDRLVTWAARWSGLRADLRAFYCALAPRDRTADVALRRVLDGGRPLEGWQAAALRRLWIQATGLDVAVELCPMPRATRRTR